MIQAFFNGLSGLFSFSKGLKTVSSNVSNMNTPGFRATDNFFRNVSGGDAQGLGVEVSSTSLRTTQGELRQSGNSTDMAINGRGFFILQDDDGTQFYTRAGQFRVNDEFQMVDNVTGYTLMALGAGNTLTPLDLSALRLRAPEATANVDLAGNLVTGSSSHNITNVKVFDATGKELTLSLAFTNLSPGQPNTWSVDVTDSVLGSLGSGTIRFAAGGTPLAGFNTVAINFTSSDVAQTITFNFGTPGTLTGATQFSGASSNLAATVKDGAPLSGISTITVKDTGVLELTYGNGKKQDGPQVALAAFADESTLTQNSKALFTASNQTPEIGAGNRGAFGKIQGGYLELSNVDLAQEFGDLIIIQRGYQASSRVMTVASEMIEQLYKNSGGS